MASLGNAYVRIRGDLEGLKGDLNKALTQIKGLESAVDRSSAQMTKSFKSIEGAVSLVKGGIIALGASVSIGAIVNLTNELKNAGLASERLSMSMDAALGSTKAASSAMQFLRSEANRLGTDLFSSSSGFVKLAASAKGTALEGQATRDIFTAISTAATALKLSNDEASGAIYAISQMMSKGTVQAEELRGQLGERLPGAFQIAAKAMGVTTSELSKMLEQGQVVAADFLPKFARVLTEQYGPAATQAADSTQAAVNRMNNAWEEAKRSIGEVLLPYVAAAAEAINAAIQSIAPSTLEAKAAKLKKEIEDLRTQINQPFYFGESKNELKEKEGELNAIERQIAGISATTGEWAQGVRDLAAAENARFSKGDSWKAFYEGMENAANQTLPKITGAHESAEQSTKKHEQEVKKLIDSYIKLGESVTADSWQTKADDRYDVQSRTLDALIQQEKEYIEEGKKLGEDAWLANEQGKKDAADRAIEYQIQAEKEAAEETKKLYNKMWDDIRENFADTYYQMFEDGLDSWGDFLDSIWNMFKRLVAEMLALWTVTFIKGMFSGSGTFDLSNLFSTVSPTNILSTIGSVTGLTTAVESLSGWLGVTSASATGTTAAVAGMSGAMELAGIEAAAAANATGEASVGFAALTSSAVGMSAAVVGGALAAVFLSEAMDDITATGDPTIQILQEFEAGVRSLSEAQEDYYKTVYMGLEDAAYASKVLFGEISDAHETFTNLTVSQMDLIKQKAFELEVALSQESGALADMGLKLVDVSSDEIRMELEKLMAEFQVDPSDDWYDLVIKVDAPDSIPVDMSGLHLEGMASGGPVAGGKPIIVGEIGPELFIPSSSGNILSNSNMQRLMAMGIKGYASGTTSLPWYQDPATHSSGTTEMDMWEDLYDKTAQYMDLLSDVEKQIEAINDYYSEQIELAKSLGVSEEELNDIYEMQAAALSKVKADLVADITDYTASITGANDMLGMQMINIAQDYQQFISDLIAAGATEEEVASAQMQAAIGLLYTFASAMLDVVKSFESAIDSAYSLKYEMMGLTDAEAAWQEYMRKTGASGTMPTDYAGYLEAFSGIFKGGFSSIMENAGELSSFFSSLISDLSNQFQEWTSLKTRTEDMISAWESGFETMSAADIPILSGTSADDMTKYLDDMQEWYTSAMAVFNGFQSLIESIQTNRKQLAKSAAMAGLDTAGQIGYLTGQIESGFGALYGGMSPEDALEQAKELNDLIMERYNLEQQGLESIISAIESIKAKADELRLSAQYSLRTTGQQASVTQAEYDRLFASAMSGGASDISAFTGFVNSYLDAMMARYKSSQKYQDIYQQVLTDLGMIGNIDTTSEEAKLLETTNEYLSRLEEYSVAEQDAVKGAIESQTEVLKELLGDDGAIGGEIKRIQEQLDEIILFFDNAVQKSIDGLEMLVKALSALSALFLLAGKGFADGGIATGPTSGYPATLHGTEAIIPLSSGYVPVQITGYNTIPTASNINIHIKMPTGENITLRDVKQTASDVYFEIDKRKNSSHTIRRVSL